MDLTSGSQAATDHIKLVPIFPLSLAQKGQNVSLTEVHVCTTRNPCAVVTIKPQSLSRSVDLDSTFYLFLVIVL